MLSLVGICEEYVQSFYIITFITGRFRHQSYSITLHDQYQTISPRYYAHHIYNDIQLIIPIENYATFYSLIYIYIGPLFKGVFSYTRYRRFRKSNIR